MKTGEKAAAGFKDSSGLLKAPDKSVNVKAVTEKE